MRHLSRLKVGIREGEGLRHRERSLALSKTDRVVVFIFVVKVIGAGDGVALITLLVGARHGGRVGI